MSTNLRFNHVLNQLAKVATMAIVLCLSGGRGAHAQVVQTQCLEIEKERYGDFHFVVPGGDKGLIIFRETSEDDKHGVTWDVRGYDTGLEEQWAIELKVDWKHVFKAYEYHDGYLYLLYGTGDDFRSDFQIERIAIADGALDTFEIENDIDLELTNMVVSGRNLVMGGYILNRPAVVLYNLESERLKVLPGFFQKKSHIIDLGLNDPDTTFNVLFSERSYQGGNLLKLRTYGSNGGSLFEYDLKMDTRYRLLGGKSTYALGDAMVIAGVFGSANSYYSQGLFFARIGQDGEVSTKYHYYADLANFFDYMHPKRTDRIKSKILRSKSKGKTFEFKSRLLLHQLVTGRDGYLLQAEVNQAKFEYENPEFRNDPSQLSATSTASAGTRKYVVRPSGRGYGGTDASKFAYREAVLVQLNPKGKIVWDASFKVEDVEKASLQQIVAMSKTNNRVELLYKSNAQMASKVLRHGKAIYEDSVQQILPKHEDDKLFDNPYEALGRAEHWYGGHYLVWGYRRLARGNTNDKKNFFYINKVHFE